MKKFFNTFKEQLLVVPILIIGFFLLNLFLSVHNPNDAFFSPYSLLDTVVSRLVLSAFILSTGWIIYWFTFPQMHRFFIDYIYHGWDELNEDVKRNISIIFLITIFICLSLMARSQNTELRKDIVSSLNSQLYVKEVTNNSSPEINIYLKNVHAAPRSPWCAAFVGTNLTWCNITNPNSAWSPNYAKPEDIIWTYPKPTHKPLPGDVVTYYFSNLGRVGHTGFYIDTDKDGYFITIEGNTGSGTLNREGDGVYKRKRGQYQIHAITRYIK